MVNTVDMTEEFWRPVYEFETLYEVSNFGRVRSSDRLVTVEHKTGTRMRFCVGRIKAISPPSKTCKYETVVFSLAGKSVTRLVHRLVAQAFVENPRRLNEVNHFDEDRLNNRADNLQWCTRNENVAHSLSRTRIANKVNRNQVQAIYADGTTRIWPSQRDAEITLRGCQTGGVSWALKTGRTIYGAKWSIVGDSV
jgi:hypothetical protein